MQVKEMRNLYQIMVRKSWREETTWTTES